MDEWANHRMREERVHALVELCPALVLCRRVAQSVLSAPTTSSTALVLGTVGGEPAGENASRAMRLWTAARQQHGSAVRAALCRAPAAQAAQRVPLARLLLLLVSEIFFGGRTGGRRRGHRRSSPTRSSAVIADAGIADAVIADAVIADAVIADAVIASGPVALTTPDARGGDH